MYNAADSQFCVAIIIFSSAYYISTDDTALTAIFDAMYDYQNYTCVRFKPRAPEDEDFVKFYNGYGLVIL